MIGAGKLGVDWDWYHDYGWGDDVMSLMKNGTVIEAVYTWKAFKDEGEVCLTCI